MLLANIPPTIIEPFANGNAANRTAPFPVASVVGTTPNGASLQDGFPSITGQPESGGGLPPIYADFNGVLYLITQNINWQNAGGLFPYSAAFASGIGGYPKGALLARADGTGFWLSLEDNNSTNPETTSGEWFPIGNSGAASVNVAAGGTITLTPLQYAKNLIVLSGTLGANCSLVFPANAGEVWLVLDLTTPGSYHTTLTTGAGSTVTSAAVGSPQPIVCDGTQLLSPFYNATLTGNPTAPTQSTSDNSMRLATTAFVQALFGAATITPATGVDASGIFEYSNILLSISKGSTVINILFGTYAQIAGHGPTNYAPGSTYALTFNNGSGGTFNLGTPVGGTVSYGPSTGNPTAMDLPVLGASGLTARVVTGTNAGPWNMAFSYVVAGFS